MCVKLLYKHKLRSYLRLSRDPMLRPRKVDLVLLIRWSVGFGSIFRFCLEAGSGIFLITEVIFNHFDIIQASVCNAKQCTSTIVVQLSQCNATRVQHNKLTIQQCYHPQPMREPRVNVSANCQIECSVRPPIGGEKTGTSGMAQLHGAIAHHSTCALKARAIKLPGACLAL